MFDLVSGRATHIPSRPGLPVLVSGVVQTAVIALLAAFSILFVSERIPEVPAVIAFVVTAPPPPPPPPPPSAPAPARDTTPSRPEPEPEPELAAPVIVPPPVEPGPPAEPIATAAIASDLAGVDGGVPEGVAGGVVGGVVPEVLPPPPPEPPREPVRAGGRIQAPELLRRVRPEYPDVAVQGHLQGVVILEALVDEQGQVVDVTVLRSAHKVLDRAAVAAVRQWQYAPLLLNGTPQRFLLTVTLSFGLTS